MIATGEPAEIYPENEEIRPHYDGGFVDPTYINRRGRVARKRPDVIQRETLARFCMSDAGAVHWQWEHVNEGNQ